MNRISGARFGPPFRICSNSPRFTFLSWPHILPHQQDASLIWRREAFAG
jgi:hypothetical protein